MARPTRRTLAVLELLQSHGQLSGAELAGRLVHRADDTETACTARLTKYHAETAPIVPFYESKGLLKRVDGVGAPDEVTARILAALHTG